MSTDTRAIAIIAHDAKKPVMADFVSQHAAYFRTQRLVATATTGRTVKERVGVEVTPVLSGPLGGDLQIGALVATGQIKAVIFLRDPLTAHPHEPDISALMKVCDIYDVPLATNLASAGIVLGWLKAQAGA